MVTDGEIIDGLASKSAKRRPRLDPDDLWLLRELDRRNTTIVTPHPLAWVDLAEMGYVVCNLWPPSLDGHQNAYVYITDSGKERAKP